MNSLLAETLFRKVEIWRLQLHFKRVDTILRNRDMCHLSTDLCKKREHYLDQLRIYAQRGIFPHNESDLPYTPCFIDRSRRECAVAHLMIGAGQLDLADHIATVANYAYVPEMRFPQLETWAEQTGLTQEELALIQPGYYQEFSTGFLCGLLVLWTTGIAIIQANLYQMKQQKTGIIIPIIGFIVALPLLLITLFCLGEGGIAFHLSRDPDYPHHAKAMSAAIPLSFSWIVSLIVTIFIIRTSYMRVRNFMHTKRKRDE